MLCEGREGRPFDLWWPSLDGSGSSDWFILGSSDWFTSWETITSPIPSRVGGTGIHFYYY